MSFLSLLSASRTFARPCRGTRNSIWAASLLRYSSTSAANPPLIARYTDVVPFELARVQAGEKVNLRDYAKQKALGRTSYDLKTVDGKVLPADGPNFIGPNGCSLREPRSPTNQEVVRNFRGPNVRVYILPKGAKLPPSLVILHEHSDHFSMQCTKPMTLTELNKELTKFINEHAKVLTKDQFDDEYPFGE